MSHAISRLFVVHCAALAALAAAGCGNGTSDSTTTTDAQLAADATDAADAATDAVPADTAVEDDTADAEPDGSPDAGIDYAQTPSGQQLVWLIGVVNNWQAKQLSAEDYEAHFTEAYRAENKLAVFQTVVLKGTLVKQGKLTIQGWEAGYGETPVAQLRGDLANHWTRLAVMVEPLPPHRITEIHRRWALDLDPDWGPPDADEVDMSAWNLSDQPATGLEVVVLDWKTGKPLDPPVTAKVDAKYGAVRLKIPSGQGKVGVRVVQSDGQVTDTFSTALKSGAGDHVFAVAGKKILTSMTKAVGLPVTAGKAHVYGALSYLPKEKSIAYEFAMPIGCAQVSFETVSDGSIFYGVPPNGLPDKTAVQTHSESSNWFAFNLEPAPMGFVVQAKGPPLTVEPLPLSADVFTVVFARFPEAVYPTNPSPGPCAK